MAKPPDYSSAHYNATVTLQPTTVSASAVVSGSATMSVSAIVLLGDESLAKMGKDAARAAGMSFDTVTVKREPDSSGEPAYFFTYRLFPGATVSGKMQSDVMGELRDQLMMLGDSRYPYVILTSA